MTDNQNNPPNQKPEGDTSAAESQPLQNSGRRESGQRNEGNRQDGNRRPYKPQQQREHGGQNPNAQQQPQKFKPSRPQHQNQTSHSPQQQQGQNQETTQDGTISTQSQQHQNQNDRRPNPHQSRREREGGGQQQPRQKQNYQGQQQRHSYAQQYGASYQPSQQSQAQSHDQNSQQQRPHQQGDLPPKRFRNVVLIGMPGSGKSSIGKTYAYLTKRNFIDLDRLVEHSMGKSVAQIFADDGEEAFRQAESKCLKKISRYHNCVVAMGGGTVCEENNLNTARQMGFVVYLESPTSVLSTRLFREMKTKPRPMFNDVQSADELAKKLDSLLQVRTEFYEKADHIVRTGFTSVDATALELLACEGKAFHREYQRLVAAVGKQAPLAVFPQGHYWMVKRFAPRREGITENREGVEMTAPQSEDQNTENEDSSAEQQELNEQSSPISALE